MGPEPTTATLPKFCMFWSPDRQTVSCDIDTYTHHGPTQTDPSHDLAHLLVAANGTLPWKPGGWRRKAKLAEYNAFLVENILDMAYSCVTYRSMRVEQILPQALSRARWFVEEHFAPFPMSTEAAFDEFRTKIDSASIVRLSPHFFSQKAREKIDPDFRKRTYQLSFQPHGVLPIDQTSFAFQDVVCGVMSQIHSFSYDQFYLDDQRRNVVHPSNGCRICSIGSSLGNLMELILSHIRVRRSKWRKIR